MSSVLTPDTHAIISTFLIFYGSIKMCVCCNINVSLNQNPLSKMFRATFMYFVHEKRTKEVTVNVIHIGGKEVISG